MGFSGRLNETCSLVFDEDCFDSGAAIDAEVNAKQLGFPLSLDLRALEPSAPGNPRPVFMTARFSRDGRAADQLKNSS
jgi:single-stranded DNA-specific DHH superfamily exonuclease